MTLHINQSKESPKWIESAVTSFIENSAENTLKNQNNDKAFVGIFKGR